MNKRFLTLFLALALFLSLTSACIYTAEPVWAAWEERGDVTSIFKDVPRNAWYASYLQEAYNYGIVGGMSLDKYGPDNNLTHAQIMVMVANLHSCIKEDDFQPKSIPGDHWSASFRNYCKAEGIIDSRFDTKLDKNVTRAEMAYYFARIFEDAFWTYMEGSYTEQDTVTFRDMPKNGYDEYIMKLAKAGIVGGFSDSTFRPGTLVTRAQASVFVSNVIYTGMGMGAYSYWVNKNTPVTQTPLPADYQKFADFLIEQFPEIQEYINKELPPVDQLTEAMMWEWRYDQLYDDLVEIYIFSHDMSSGANILTATFEYNYSTGVWTLTQIDGAMFW